MVKPNSKILPKIELIPLVELPVPKSTELNFPHGSIITNFNEWDHYFRNRLSAHYDNPGEPIAPAPGVYLFKLLDLSDKDLLHLVQFHLGNSPIDDSSSLFGGYALSINGKFLLYPQCCGMLSEINDWALILDDDFEPFYLSECHPSPRFEKVGEEVHIICEEDGTGPFIPETLHSFTIEHLLLSNAIKKTTLELETFSKKLNKITRNHYPKETSRFLIWEEV